MADFTGASASPWNRLTILGWSAAAALAVTLGWSLLRPEPPQPVTRIELSPASEVDLGAFHRGFAVAPDGRAIVFADGSGQLYHRDLRQLDAVPIPGTGNAWYPFFSPDGEWVGYFDQEDNSLKKARLDRREVQTLAPVPATLRSASWGLDGTIVLHSSVLDGLWRVRDTGGELEPIANTEGPVLCGDRQVVAVSLETGERTVLFPGTTARYVSTGHVVFWRDNDLWAVGFDPEQLAVIGEPTPIVEGVPADQNNDFARFAVGGDLLFYQEGGGGQEQVPQWLGRDGSAEVLSATLTGSIRDPAVSPDGKQIAFEYVSDAGGDIWVYDLDQETFSRLTFAGSENMHPFWRPDGSEVGFSSVRDGLMSLYSRPVDLSGEARLLLADPDDGLYEARWTPDGRWLVYRRGSRLAAGGVDLFYSAPHADSTAVVILDTPAEELNPSLSPDGRWLAYTSDESGETEVYVRPFPGPGGRSQVSTEGGRNPMWAHNGREIFYLAWDSFSLTVTTVRTDPDFAVESREQLFTWDPFVSSTANLHWDLSPDDQRILAIGAPPATGGDGVGRYVGVLNFLEELKERVGN